MFYSRLVAKWWLNRVLLAKVVLSRFLLKQLFLSPSWPLCQYPIRPSASWAIALEPIRARGIIVKHVALHSECSQIFSCQLG